MGHITNESLVWNVERQSMILMQGSLPKKKKKLMQGTWIKDYK